jgi:hypothetical protein
VVTVGVAVGLGQVVQLRPVEGDQLYVEAPLAVRETFPPIHIAGAEGVTVTTGNGCTVTVTVAVFVQPLEEVPVTVYVVVTVGEAVGLTQLVQLNPVEGDHT